MVAGLPELLIILVILAIFFGAGKVPQVMEAMGHGVKQFRKASEETDKIKAELEGDVDPS